MPVRLKDRLNASNAQVKSRETLPGPSLIHYENLFEQGYCIIL